MWVKGVPTVEYKGRLIWKKSFKTSHKSGKNDHPSIIAGSLVPYRKGLSKTRLQVDPTERVHQIFTTQCTKIDT